MKTDSRTKIGAWMMLLTLIPFLIVQVSELFDSQSWRRIVVLITLIVSASATLLLLALSVLQNSKAILNLAQAFLSSH